jgi:pilus assembly protein Flp/PilA
LAGINLQLIAAPSNKGDNMRNLFLTLLRDDSGQDLIEYALVAGLIALGATAAMGPLANTIGNAFNSVGTSLTNSMPKSS